MTEERKCAWCGVDISHRHGSAKYCSHGCSRLWHDRDASKKNACHSRGAIGPWPGANCRVCGATFEARSKRQIYCSNLCKEKASNERKAAARAKRWPTKKGRICGWCHSAFDASDMKQKFCCPACTTAYQNKKNYSKRDHRADYERAIAKDRDGYFARAAERSRQWRERDPEYARAKDREWSRRMAAERALAILLLPTSQPPEE